MVCPVTVAVQRFDSPATVLKLFVPKAIGYQTTGSKIMGLQTSSFL
jgi:hypothetical protein